MPDIKLDQQNETTAALNEKPAVAGQLEKSLESLAEKVEKRKFASGENQAVTENSAAEAIGPVAANSAAGIMAPAAKRQNQV